MKETPITVLCDFYNEELLLPYWLMQYVPWVTRIIAVVNTRSTDRTKELLLADKSGKVEVVDYTAPGDGLLDDGARIENLNRIYQTVKDGWVLCIDADEFVPDCREALLKSSYVVRNVALHGIFRHKDDADLDPTLPLLHQRKHGTVLNGNDPLYQKPCLVYAKCGTGWTPGKHTFLSDNPIDPTYVKGTHVYAADPTILFARHVKRANEPMSETNITHRWAIHASQYTKAYAKQLIAEHMNDGVLL